MRKKFPWWLRLAALSVMLTLAAWSGFLIIFGDEPLPSFEGLENSPIERAPPEEDPWRLVFGRRVAEETFLTELGVTGAQLEEFSELNSHLSFSPDGDGPRTLADLETTVAALAGDPDSQRIVDVGLDWIEELGRAGVYERRDGDPFGVFEEVGDYRWVRTIMDWIRLSSTARGENEIARRALQIVFAFQLDLARLARKQGGIPTSDLQRHVLRPYLDCLEKGVLDHELDAWQERLTSLPSGEWLQREWILTIYWQFRAEVTDRELLIERLTNLGLFAGEPSPLLPHVQGERTRIKPHRALRRVGERCHAELRRGRRPPGRLPERNKPNWFERVIDPYGEDWVRFWTDFEFTDSLLLRYEVDIDQSTLATALRRSFRDRGEWPETLDALVPVYLPALPVDPYTGKPWHYDRDRKIIWSVGENLLDDGGDSDLDEVRVLGEPR